MLKKRIKVSKNFFLDEFLSPKIYEKLFLGKEDYWQSVVDKNNGTFYKLFFNGIRLEKLVKIAQFLRDRYGKSVTINNWGSGGDRVNSGVRDKDSTEGAPLSAHKDWYAIDAVVSGVDEKDIHKDVINNQKEWMEIGVTEIEEGTWDESTGEGWSHLSTRPTGLNYIKRIGFWKKEQKKN